MRFDETHDRVSVEGAYARLTADPNRFSDVVIGLETSVGLGIRIAYPEQGEMGYVYRICVGYGEVCKTCSRLGAELGLVIGAPSPIRLELKLHKYYYLIYII